MKISSGQVQFRTQHSSHRSRQTREELTVVTPHRRLRLQREESMVQGDRSIEINHSASQRTPRQVSQPGVSTEVSETETDSGDEESSGFPAPKETMELKLLDQMFEALLEGDFEPITPEGKGEEDSGRKTETSDDAPDPAEAYHQEPRASRAQQPSPRSGNESGVGISYSYEETVKESESLTVQAEGIVKTADGQTLSVDLSLQMNRSFERHSSVQFRAGNTRLLDPIVVNYEGPAAELSDNRTIRFDLNADGAAEHMPALAPGSGFLALDRNENGRIDDGHELFGPRTGRGFEELQELDADGNKFIDGGDPVFEDLMILDSSITEGRKLLSLEEAGVAAIGLQSTSSEYTYKNPADNRTRGRVQRTGLFLGRDGSAGTVQQIKLAAISPSEHLNT